MSFNILVVDDSPAMRAVLKKSIRASGFGDTNLLEAANGEEALDVLNQNWFDLVITDYNMPKMDGLELICAMKKNEIFSTIPILVITTEGSRERVDEFMQNGATDYLKKPFTPQNIKLKLTQILGEWQDEEEIASGAEDLDF